MKYSQLFGKPNLNPQQPAADGIDHLFNINFLQMDENELITIMPIGLETTHKLYDIISSEFKTLDGQEIQTPFILPLNLLEASQRDALFKHNLISFQDQEQTQTFALSPAQEEAISRKLQETISGYDDLPLFIYQKHAQYKRKNLQLNQLSSNEYSIIEGYSFHQSYTDLNNFFPKVFATFQRIFKRCHLEIIHAESGDNDKGSEKAIEFIVPYSNGNEEIIRCTHCGYTANKVIAKGIKQIEVEAPRALQKISLPSNTLWTVEGLSDAIQTDASHIAISKLFKTLSGFVMTVVRADYEISIEKLINYIQEPILREANADDFEALGVLPSGFSPMAPIEGIPIILDDTLANSSNLVMNGKKAKNAYINCNFGLDYESERICDITQIKKGDRCSQCGAPLTEFNAIKIGSLYKIGDHFSKSLHFTLINPRGRETYPHMATFNIEMNSLYLAIALQNSDTKGLIWPASIAPFQFYLLGITRTSRTNRAIEKIYNQYKAFTLWDNRDIPPEEKIKTGTLLGIPVLISIHDSDLHSHAIRIHHRNQSEPEELIPFDQFDEWMKKTIVQAKN